MTEPLLVSPSEDLTGQGALARLLPEDGLKSHRPPALVAGASCYDG